MAASPNIFSSQVILAENTGVLCRPHSEWKGFYGNSIGKPAGSVQIPLAFHVVLTSQPDLSGQLSNCIYKIPETWMDVGWNYFLYPPLDYNINGLYPWDWGVVSFQKRRFPDSSWVEYDICDVITETGAVSFSNAVAECEKLQSSDNTAAGAINNNGSSSRNAPFSSSSTKACRRQRFNHSPDVMELANSPYTSTPKNGRCNDYLSNSVNRICGNANVSTGSSISSTPVGNNRVTPIAMNGVIAITPHRFTPPSSHRENTKKTSVVSKSSEAISVGDKQTESSSNGNADEEKLYKKKVLEVLIETLNVVKDLRDPHITKERVIRENLDHFKIVVKSQLTLPLNLPEEVGVLNTAIIDVELSISLCCVQIHTLRSLSSEDKVAKALLVNLITRSVCSQVQWKIRGRDRRIGIGHLVIFIAIFGVVIKNILEQHKQSVLPLSKLISTIQAASKYHSYEYFNSKSEGNGNLQTKGKGGVGQQGKRLKTNSSFFQ